MSKELHILVVSFVAVATLGQQSVPQSVNGLTLSPSKYQSVIEAQNVSPSEEILLTLVWFAVGYIGIGLTAIIIEHIQSKNIAVSFMLLFFIFQGALDIMDVLSDATVANQLMSGSIHQCGWTQCTFPDFFNNYGNALLVCVIIGGIITFITSCFVFTDIFSRIRGTHEDKSNYTRDKREISLILLKLFFADFPAVIIYLNLWDVSWTGAGVTVSVVTAISFCITCVDMLYASIMVRYKSSQHAQSLGIMLCGENERSLVQCTQCCGLTVFLTVLVGVGLLAERMLNDKYDYSMPRLSIGETCYDPYWGYFGDGSYMEHNDDDYSYMIESIALLDMEVYNSFTDTDENEKFTFSFTYRSHKKGADPEQVLEFSDFATYRQKYSDSTTFFPAESGIKCIIYGFPFAVEYNQYFSTGPWYATFTASNIEYGCYDTIWSCEGVDYMTSTAVQICVDKCEWH
eukprot:15908_1